MGKRLQPIKDMNEIERITVELSRRKDRRGQRMFLMWVVGVNMGLRIGDLVELKVGDLRQETYTFTPNKQERKRFVQNIQLPVPAEVRRVIKVRCAGMGDDEWLLQSQKKKPTKGKDPTKKKKERPVNPGAISRQTARRDMKEIAKYCGLDMEIGCHTMRKTFGYHYYQKFHEVAWLRKWFDHSSDTTTMKYIGIELEEFSEAVEKSPFKGMLKGCDL